MSFLPGALLLVAAFWTITNAKSASNVCGVSVAAVVTNVTLPGGETGDCQFSAANGRITVCSGRSATTIDATSAICFLSDDGFDKERVDTTSYGPGDTPITLADGSRLMVESNVQTGGYLNNTFDLQNSTFVVEDGCTVNFGYIIAKDSNVHVHQNQYVAVLDLNMTNSTLDIANNKHYITFTNMDMTNSIVNIAFNMDMFLAPITMINSTMNIASTSSTFFRWASLRFVGSELTVDSGGILNITSAVIEIQDGSISIGKSGNVVLDVWSRLVFKKNYKEGPRPSLTISNATLSVPAYVTCTVTGPITITSGNVTWSSGYSADGVTCFEDQGFRGFQGSGIGVPNIMARGQRGRWSRLQDRKVVPYGFPSFMDWILWKKT